ncbi:fungal fruit body lectin-domain-containing protein [Panaeolus papilionaceus]|nr:fungal fruit body lectin-domain-containing protein [Panaeolus papilionaceus]
MRKASLSVARRSVPEVPLPPMVRTCTSFDLFHFAPLAKYQAVLSATLKKAVAESTAWYFANGAKWNKSNDVHVLTMGGSGTSGTLRLATDSEAFLIALGVHNYKSWIDIQPNLSNTQTGVALHPDYYKAGTASAAQREKVLTQYSVKNSQGRSLSVNCAGSGSQSINCDIIIG